ncbi:DUF4158 domain-containing protein [Streptomyces sp. NPDC101221]|uniref:DUF4158 domain-containing protein n=1 Tax=Streptomyces sp. NPDC101221 TaxID=3366132 RepID=UPI00380BF585
MDCPAVIVSDVAPLQPAIELAAVGVRGQGPGAVGVQELSPGELEQFFRLITRALGLARVKRRPATRLGWAVQWGTVRMLGTFLTEDPAAVPASVVWFVAEQLGIDDEHFAEYGSRSQTAYEHAWEIRDQYGYRDFAAGEEELREFLVARVWSSLEGPRVVRPGGGGVGQQPGAAARGYDAGLEERCLASTHRASTDPGAVQGRFLRGTGMLGV